MNDRSNGSSEHSTGQPRDVADGSNPSMASYNLRPTQRRAQNATASASAKQTTQDQLIPEGPTSQLPNVAPQLQDNAGAAPPGTPKASSTPAVAGTIKETHFPNRTRQTPILISRELGVRQVVSSRDHGSVCSTLTEDTVIEVTKGGEDFEDETAGFIDDEVLLPATEASGVQVHELHFETGRTEPSPESKPEVTKNVFEDKMFDFFMDQETAVLPKENDSATMFFSSSSNESPSGCEEDGQLQTDLMLSTMKTNLSRIGQLMDSLTVRARIVSDSEVQNSRNGGPSLESLPKDQLLTKAVDQSRPTDAIQTVKSPPVPTNTTGPPQPQVNQGAVGVSTQSSPPALVVDKQAAAVAELRQTTNLLVDLVSKSQQHTNQAAATTKTAIEYLRAQFATIRETQGHAETEANQLSEDVSKVILKMDTRFHEFESRHREVREQQNEIKQQQNTIRKQQDEI